MSIKELYDRQAKIWKEENENYFGLTPLIDWEDTLAVKQHLEKCAEKFWNNGSNKLKELFENGKCKDIDKLIIGSYELVFDHTNEIVCLYAKFKDEKINRETEDLIVTEKRAPLAYLPYSNDLCWFLNGTEYVLRISATVNYSLISRTNNIIKYQKAWSYDIENKEFKLSSDLDPYDDLTTANKIFLESCFGQEVTKDNFENALNSVPAFDNNSIVFFKFGYVDEIFKIVSGSNRFANPLMKVSIPINIVKMLATQKNREDKKDNGSFSNLVLSTNKIFALENSRTAIYKSIFNGSFSFSDSNKIFDAFKTSTNKSAGRTRLLLDDVIVKDGFLWNKVDGKYYNAIHLILDDELKVENNLSELSCSRFSSSNDAKRLMMTAKLRAQAVPTVGEIDSFTHETPARIVFGDFEGFNFGDSIIISRSYAQKLKSYCDKKIKFSSVSDYNMIKEKYQIGDFISLKDFKSITKSNMYNNYRSVQIRAIEQGYVAISAEIPFGVGDKITNFHGSKGIVSLILEDDEMPYLKDDIFDFKAGPFDVLVSGLSVYKRKTFGQFFEAWSLATGNNDVNTIKDAVFKYSENMVEFSEKSIVYFNGKKSIKPCGINMMIRLNHDAVTKQSYSYIKSNYARMLKFGEMELLNLASRGLYDIINELDIRSISKHYDSFAQIQKMQMTGECEIQTANNLRFFNILKNIGFDFNLRGEILESKDYSFEQLRTLISDKQIELFDEGDLENEGFSEKNENS